MKKIVVVCLIAVLLSGKACQTDDSVALYQQNQTGTPSTNHSSASSPDQTDNATYQFSGTLRDEKYDGNVIVDGFLVACITRPDPTLESALLASSPEYLILSDSEASNLRDFIDQAVNNLYIMNYTNNNEEEIQSQREIIFSPSIAPLVNSALDTQITIRTNKLKYKLTTDVVSANVLQNNFVVKYSTNIGDTVYRIWVEFPMEIDSSSDNKDVFFEKYPQYNNGQTLFDVWMYIKIPEDNNTKMQIVGMTEIVGRDSIVSIYNGTSNSTQAKQNPTIFENRSVEYVQDTSLSKDQIIQIQSSAKLFEGSLYSGDKTTMTADKLKEIILPLCTDDFSDKLVSTQYFEKYCQEIENANASMSASDYSSMLEGMSKDANSGYALQEFLLDDGTIAYFYYDNWMGSVIADRDLNETYGLKRCEMENGRRFYLTSFFFVNIDGTFYIKDFLNCETGEGETNGTGNG